MKLKKALYGLKQSGRQWNCKLNSLLNEIEFYACESEPCLYIRKSENKVYIIAVYVDDMLIACSDINDMKFIKREISKRVEVVDKGPVNHFLNIEIERGGPTASIEISQMNDCRSVITPLEPNSQIACNNENCISH